MNKLGFLMALSLGCLPVMACATDLIDDFSQLPSAINVSSDNQDIEVNSALDELQKANVAIPDNEVFIVVDRNPKSQLLTIVQHISGNDYQVVGSSHVSTGKPGRKEHFVTPVGVFDYNGDILGYRAEGTFNSNHIRGLGLKGKRAWDFGWQETDNWKYPGEKTQIRMEMHATDPANLEHRIGRPDSEGCIRIHADVNEFLDHYGILDKIPNQLSTTDKRWKYLLGKEHKFIPEAGEYYVIVDNNLKEEK